MLKILCVCGNGMGTSTILKVSIKSIMNKLGVKAEVESCSAGEAMSFMPQTDIVITTPEWSKMINVPSNVALVTATNLIDAKNVETLLVDTIKEKFPEKLK